MIENQPKPIQGRKPNAVDRAEEIYTSLLQADLEPAFDGQHVAIHPESGEYEVHRWPGHALRALEARQPIGPIIVRYIGYGDAALRARITGTGLK